MISVSAYRYLRLLLELALFAAATVLVLALLSLASAQTRAPRSAPPVGTQETAFPAAQLEQPAYREYRGVSIGMTAEQARQRLGTPSDTNERQDFFVFSSAETRPDGSVYRLVRYQHAGYFVVYTRADGDAPPLVTVTMQKIID